jgi:hypothetical protein
MMEPLAGGRLRDRAGLQPRGQVADVGVQRDFEKGRMLALSDCGRRKQRRELPGDDPARGAAQPRPRIFRLAGQRVDVSQQRAQLEVLVEIEREQLCEQRESLGARQVGLVARGGLAALALQQRPDEFPEHRRAQVGFRLLALVAQGLQVVLVGDRDFAFLERIRRIQADHRGRDGQ